MSYWPWWSGGALLAAVAVTHWMVVKRPLGVSGAFARVADAALPSNGAPARPGQSQWTADLVFLLSMVAGGALAAWWRGGLHLSFSLDPTYARLFGTGAGALAALFLGGVMVGYGTRLAGGCTSGHGLSGVSRLQPASLAATAGFFGAGIALSVALARWLP